MVYMKKDTINYLLATICGICALPSIAQVTPPVYSGTTPVNYVRSWVAQSPQTDGSAISSLPTKQSIQTTRYVDGLGRPMQTVVKQGSLYGGSFVDMVSTNYYDAYGREANKFLPFAANNAGGATALTDGSFKYNSGQQQAAFYNPANANSPITSQTESWFYGSTDFEASPLNRPLKVKPAGNSWVGSNRGVVTDYATNTAVDDVAIFNVTPPTGITYSSFSRSGSYAAGLLFKTITTNENGKQTIEFKNKEGQVILRKCN